MNWLEYENDRDETTLLLKYSSILNSIKSSYCLYLKEYPGMLQCDAPVGDNHDYISVTQMLLAQGKCFNNSCDREGTKRSKGGSGYGGKKK